MATSGASGYVFKVLDAEGSSFCADNVVRAGLTPKLRDVKTLLSMLTYSQQPASDQFLTPQPFRDAKHTMLYDPPIEEFAVLLTRLEAGQQEVHDQIAGPSILIVTDGRGILQSVGLEHGQHEFQHIGEVFFVAADTKITLTAATDRNLTVFRAFTVAPPSS